MSKAIKSTNPIKPIIMALLKAKSGANRITNVVETKDGEGNKVYAGKCLKKLEGVNKYASMGVFTVYEDAVINYAYKNRK